MTKNVVKDKSLRFAIRVVNLYQLFVSDKKEYVLSKQLLRSGTSVGAMVREAEHAETKKDFILALERAITLKKNSEKFNTMRISGMQKDLSFASSALRYLEIYKKE